MDWKRRAEFLGMPNDWPSPDPFVQNIETLKISDDQPYIYRLSHLGVEAQRLSRGVEFASEVSRLIWDGCKGWDQGEHLKHAVERAGLDLESMEREIAQGDHREDIEHNHELLERAGHWGVPTFVFNGEPFFGQDRIDTLCWRLDQNGLRK